MSDSDSVTARPRSMAERLGLDPAVFARKYGRDWHLSVVEAADITPHMRRVVFAGGDLDQMGVKPGQSLVLLLPQAAGEPLRRHYTIRSLDQGARRLTVDFVLHGDAPATNWARSVRPGDEIDVLGPRGRVWLDPEADWHLFAGDETGLPAIAAMLEGLAPGATATAVIEVADKSDEQAIRTRADLNLIWLYRGGPARPGSQPLIDALGSIAIPAERKVRAYLTGETSTVRAQRHGLIARGLSKEQISAEGYWRPGRVGGHDHVDE